MFGIRHGVQWSLGKFTTIAVGSYGLDVRYTTKPSNGFRGVFSSSIGPYIEGYKNIPYNTSSWFIWQDPAGVLRYQQLTDRPPDPAANSPVGVQDLNYKNLSSVSLAFDQNNNRVISWSEKNLCFVSYYDENNQLQRVNWIGYDSISFFDGIFLGQDGSDVIIFYLDSTKTQVKYRLQRDRFSIEYTHHVFRAAFFNVAPTTFNLDHIEVTDHTYILFLTDAAGREVQLESYSYGFDSQDAAQSTVALASGRYQFLAIADTSDQPEKLLNLLSFYKGSYDIVSKLIENREDINHAITLSGGVAPKRVSEFSSEDALSTALSMSRGTSYNIQERTALGADSCVNTLILRGGVSTSQKITSSRDDVSLSQAVGRGVSTQKTFVVDYILESIAHSIFPPNGLAFLYERVLLDSNEAVEHSLDVSRGEYLDRVNFLYDNEAFSSTYNFSRGTYDIKFITTELLRDSSVLAIELTGGSLQDASNIYIDDTAYSQVALQYGAHYETTKRTTTLETLLQNISISKGGYRGLHQYGDIITDNSIVIFSPPSGTYSPSNIKPVTLDQDAALAIYGFSSGAYYLDVPIDIYDVAYAYFVSPDNLYYGSELSYNDSTDVLISTFLES